MKISDREVSYITNKTLDDTGRVFICDNKILRGINKNRSGFIRGLFSSGFINELIEKGLFVESRISDYCHDGYDFVVEHKKIDPTIYPHNWTFSMLKDAALLVLDIADVCEKYGYNMKDCHYLNILIDNGKPKFIDLGSFIEGDKEKDFTWLPYEEFLQCYIYPLQFWSIGLISLSKIFISYGNKISHVDYALFNRKIFRFANLNLVKKIIKFKFLFFIFLRSDNDRVRNKLNKKMGNGIGDKFFISFTLFLKKILNKLGFLNRHSIKNFRKKVLKIKRPKIKSVWGDYYYRGGNPDDRFSRIIELVKVYCPEAKSSFDFGGNTGKFSERCLKELSLDRSFCQDIDEEAIDYGYVNNRENDLILLNFNPFFSSPINKGYPSGDEKNFSSDIVFALALTHHLILGQSFSLDHIFERFSSFSNKYVCIEFMPKGLWVPGEKVDIPDWYNIDWFRSNFLKYFDILKEEALEENRIVFIGRKIK